MTLAAIVPTIARIGECPGALRRGIVAGICWGLTVGLGLPLLALLDRGVVCLSDVAVTTVVSVVAGILTIGPLAVFRRTV
jgi:TM2 domain-containing membrane protein YozV